MALSAQELHNILSQLPPGPRMPAIFIGHGSPSNALADNAFTRALAQIAQGLNEPPRAILVISAHWLTSGIKVQAGERPETIHDFGGFADELYRIQYPAPGAPLYARATAQLLSGAAIETKEWGLDHGAWAVLRHIFPEARIPVFQLSLDWARKIDFHFEFARALSPLRDRGVLIVGSGNIVHNLKQSMPRFMSGDARPFDWAVEFDAWVKKQVDSRNYSALSRFADAGQAALLSVPSPEHYVPLLYAAAVAEPREAVTQIYEEVCYGGISMRTFRVEAD
ncbi:MAG TPA: 4,5-DOPA dioxygenase extradiol [Bryobacteraceae bacterium]|jgi:4,5-DOPA dioxygenase extradiol